LSATSSIDRVYFTVDQANRMIPLLEERFTRMLQLHGQIRIVHERLSPTGYAPEDDEFDVSPSGASHEVISDLASLRTLIDALIADLSELQASGCVIKSVDTGLVDWYSKLEGREVFLCWKLGEKEVSWWHELDAGFAGRQRLRANDAGEDT
jgi:hypothetical protein